MLLIHQYLCRLSAGDESARWLPFTFLAVVVLLCGIIPLLFLLLTDAELAIYMTQKTQNKLICGALLFILLGAGLVCAEYQLFFHYDGVNNVV